MFKKRKLKHEEKLLEKSRGDVFEKIAEDAGVDISSEKKQTDKNTRIKKAKTKKAKTGKEKPQREPSVSRDGSAKSYIVILILGIVIGVLLTFLGVFIYSGYINLNLGPLGVISLKMPYYDELHNDVEDGNVDRVELNRKIDEMMKLVGNNYLYDIDEEDIAEGIFNGVAAGLAESDKYAAYYPVEDFEQKQQQFNGNYIGIGVTVQKDPVTGGVLVISPQPNGPAAEAGIMADDIIIRADGVDITKLSLSEATQEHIMGEEGTFVKLIVLRDGKTYEFNVERRQLVNTSVRGLMIGDGNIAYIGINAFNTNTENEFKYVLNELMESNPEGIIFDVRNNGGGDMITCLKMLDYLLDDDISTYSSSFSLGANDGKTLLLYIEDKKGQKDYYVAGDGHSVELPIVVLTNESSASASEIFTGVLRNYGAKSVGTNSFGKGIVQTVYTLNDRSALKFTTSQYVLPNGDKIHGIGISPDVEVKLKKIPVEIEDSRFEKVVARAYPAVNDVLDEDIDIDEDSQLREAINVLKDMMSE